MIKGLSSKPILVQVRIAATISLAVHGALLLIEWYAVSPIGYGGWGLLCLAPLAMFPLILALLAIPLSVFALPFKRLRRPALALLVCCSLYVLTGLGALQLGETVRMTAFQRLAVRSQPLVDAVHRFAEEQNRPPKDLHELVPPYLPEIPRTGMATYPEYVYLSGEADSWDGNPWVLFVNTPSGGINFDMFMYFPLQNYPRQGHGGSLERVGKWAYVHE
jgi:hypothetical protein